MKIINYDKLFAEFKRDGAISEDANEIANTLIRELCVQTGTGLARFLGVRSCFDNHMALRVWVQQRLDDNPDYLVEPPRLYRRVIYLSQAAMSDRVKLS